MSTGGVPAASCAASWSARSRNTSRVRAPRRVRRIRSGVVGEPTILLRLGEAALRLGRVGPELLEPLAMIARNMFCAPAEGEHHVLELMRGPHAIFGKAFGRVHGAKG